MSTAPVGRVWVLVLAAIAGVAGAAPAAAQAGAGDSDPRLHITAEGAVSLRDFDGVRIARDLNAYGLRLELARRQAFRPWLAAARFVRPELDCVPGLPCADAGWITRAGVAIPLSPDDYEPGVHASARAGVGASFSEETELSYLVGFGVHWRQFQGVAPFAEFRWENVVGINFTTLGAGLRVDL